MLDTGTIKCCDPEQSEFDMLAGVKMGKQSKVTRSFQKVTKEKLPKLWQ